jgi:hypothetical protein
MWWDGPAAISQRWRCVRAFAGLGGLLFGLLICEIGSANAGASNDHDIFQHPLVQSFE